MKRTLLGAGAAALLGGACGGDPAIRAGAQKPKQAPALTILRTAAPGEPLLTIPRLAAVSSACVPGARRADTIVRVPARRGATTELLIGGRPAITLQPGEGRTIRSVPDAVVVLQLRQRVQPATRTVRLRVVHASRPECLVARVSFVQDTDSHSRG